MNVLDKEALEFFEEELVEETNKKLRLFEIGRSNNKIAANELGRVRLYEEKVTIKDYFKECDKEVALLVINEPAQGILGKIKSSLESQGLTWKEIEGTRMDLKHTGHPDILWDEWEKNKEIPKVRLTETGKFVKKKL